MNEEQNKFQNWLHNRRTEEFEHAELIEDGWVDTDFDVTCNEEWRVTRGMANGFDLVYGLFIVLAVHNVEKSCFVTEESIFLKLLKGLMEGIKAEQSGKDEKYADYLDGEIYAFEEVDREYRKSLQKIEEVLHGHKDSV